MKIKQLTGLCLAGLILISSGAVSHAQSLKGYDPGIENQEAYQEVVFLTGQPILMKGTLKSSVTTKKGMKTEKYTYKLENEEKEATLSRSLSIESALEDYAGQTIESGQVKSYKETVKIGGISYTADSKTSQFTQSIVYDKKPAVDYYSGNLSFRKVFKASKQPSITVDMEGTTVGYDQAWGSTETRSMNYYVSSEDAKGVQGTYAVKSSGNITKDIVYIDNQPNFISFRGGYMVSEKNESVMEYSYDLKGITGRNAMTLNNNPKFTRLNIPTLVDISGHWAEENIKVLASLKAIPPNARNFAPSLPMSREEFARAVAIISDMVPQEDTAATRKSKTAEPAMFLDTSKESDQYKYVKSVATSGIMAGVGEGKFDPKGELTKAQAASILVSALGVETLAPNGLYSTGYADDSAIPYWAKSSVYMAKQLGLIAPSEGNYLQPNRALTRAEAATMLRAYINYMSYDLKEDFRERIINY